MSRLSPGTAQKLIDELVEACRPLNDEAAHRSYLDKLTDVELLARHKAIVIDEGRPSEVNFEDLASGGVENSNVNGSSRDQDTQRGRFCGKQNLWDKTHTRFASRTSDRPARLSVFNAEVRR